MITTANGVGGTLKWYLIGMLVGESAGMTVSMSFATAKKPSGDDRPLFQGGFYALDSPTSSDETDGLLPKREKEREESLGR